MFALAPTMGCASDTNDDKTTPQTSTPDAASNADSGASSADSSGGDSGMQDAGASSSSSGAADTATSSGSTVDGGTTTDVEDTTSASSGGGTDASASGSSGGGADTASSSGGATADVTAPTTDAMSDGGTTGDASTSSPDSGASVDAGTATPQDVATGIDTGAGGCKSGEFEHPSDGSCKQASCQEMSKALAESIKELVQAHNQCKADADCAVASTSTACQGSCGAAINKQSDAPFKTKLATIDDKVCKKTGYAGKCGYLTPKCLAPSPGCVDGKCVRNKPSGPTCPKPAPANALCQDGKWVCKAGTMKLPGSIDCQAPTCSAVSSALKMELKVALDKSQACTSDKECVSVNVGHACWGACPAVVNAAHKAKVELLIKAHDGICKAADYAKKCGFMTPSCLPPNIGCKAGSCVYSK